MSWTPYDLAIIGGGINGTGIARDAAGRGARVYLCEKGDLGGGTSSASTKLIHGGLRYLEHYEFRLVREALMEREVLLRAAPHIIWPMRFVLPHHSGLRPAWLLRLGLLLYDNLGGRKALPGTRLVDLTRDPAGAPLKPEFKRGFEYSDCWVEDARLVALNALDARERGATVRTRTACVSAERADGLWRLTTRSVLDGSLETLEARALVNAAGPWIGEVLSGVVKANEPAPVRLVKGSHVVVPRLFDHDRAYIFQNADKRIMFAIPYEGGFTLLGTTDEDYRGDPGDVRISEGEKEYICASASEYFRTPVDPESIVWTYSGVRPLFDIAGTKAAHAATRDYVLQLDHPEGGAARLDIYGGKITTYRRLAEHAIEKLGPALPDLKPAWTGETPLPGGDFPPEEFNDVVAAFKARYIFLDPALARRLVRAYGTRTEQILEGAHSMGDLGRDFGEGLTAAEIDYLRAQEFALTAEDILWRRSKLGLRFSPDQARALDAFLSGADHPAAAVAG